MRTNQKRFAKIKGLAVIFFVGVLFMVGWYAWKLNTTSEQASNKISITEIPADWVTYQNKDLGISFAYPKTWAFKDKSKEQIYTKYYIGELTSDDKLTSVGIKLIRKQDGRYVYSTIEAWKAANKNIKYSNLVEVKSYYTAFSYTLTVSGAMSLVYEVLSPTNNVEIIVLPTETAAKATIEQIVETLRVEE